MKKKYCFLVFIASSGVSLILIGLVFTSGDMRLRKMLPRIVLNGLKRSDPRLTHCKHYRKKEPINFTYLYFYRKPGSRKTLLWCKVPKAGSTTFTNLLLRLAGAPEWSEDKNVTKLHRLLRNYYPRPTANDTNKISHSIKFLVVRDPFERILSAYRDKLEDYQRDLHFRDGYYYEKYGKLMVPPEENSTRVPTWPEFVNYLINTPVGRFDEHWMPITRLCSPCSIDYDYIVRLENFEDEIQVPLKRAGIQAPKLGWYHTVGQGNKGTVFKYFNTLTLLSIKKLYSKYKRDFQLFGYTPYKYFKLVN